jgi:glycyl-tRNA synthetase beta subunit
VAKQQTSQGAADIAVAYKSLFFDLPLASVKWSLGAGEERETAEAVWNGYDASVRAATNAIDALYRNPLFSDAFSRTLSAALRWQKIINTFNTAAFTSVWKALGVPTADEIQGLSEQIRALEQRLSQSVQKKDAQAILDQLRALEARLPRTAPTPLRADHHGDRAAA